MATYKVKAYGKEYSVDVIEQTHGARIIVQGYSFEVEQAVPNANKAPAAASAPAPSAPAASAAAVVATKPQPAAKPAAAKPAAKAPTGVGSVVAPIPGVITKVCVAVGDVVKAGHVVVKLEAMKMENDIAALIDGTIKEIAVSEGNEVSDGQLLVLVG